VKIVFIGNFSVPYSTESHHKWTWEKLGHEVVALQENKTTTDAVIAACQGAQVLQYTHTHGWDFGGSFPQLEMLEKARNMGVKSFSYHLDLYWGLNKLDRREDRIGEHPSWKVDYFFSTDGGNEEKYHSRGINHFWMPPGVVEYATHKGNFRQDLASDVGFVGSVGYHPEYPFRKHLIDGLKQHYGNRFRVYSGLREEPLNDAYASIKVVVGDHCFAGVPKYWSDRLPETCGRGGFIVYPKTEGLMIPVLTYEAQNLSNLIETIDYSLSHDEERVLTRNLAFDHVKNCDTYTHRLKEILQVMNV